MRKIASPKWALIVLCAAIGSILLTSLAKPLENMPLDRHRRLHYDAHGPNARKHQFYNDNYRMEETEESMKSEVPKRYYSRLSDVVLCLLMALLWTVWMLSSLVRSDLSRYQKDSVLVHGHVLEVSVEEDSLGTGIPTYKAVIDYMVKPSSSTKNTVQVRKHFETQQLLQEGFANVEILVLPQEPTYSVLREEFQQQVEEHKEDEQEAFIRQNWCKRISMAFAAFLVFLSLTGSVQVVVRLDPLIRWKGWALLLSGVVFLLPAGLLVHRAMYALQRVMEWQSAKAGVIIRGAKATMQNMWDELDELDPGACDDEPIEATGQLHDSATTAAGCYFVDVGRPKHNITTTTSVDEELTHNSNSTVSSLSAPASQALSATPGEDKGVFT